MATKCHPDGAPKGIARLLGVAWRSVGNAVQVDYTVRAIGNTPCFMND